MRGQVLSIALVVASGVASYVILKGTWASLERARQAHYEHQHFADVFAHLKRAPSSLAERIELVPGVASVETRIVEEARILLDTLIEPASAQLISLPSGGRPSLNDIALVRGRLVDPSRSEEAVVLESFAAPVVPQNVVRLRDMSRDDREGDPADRARTLTCVADGSTSAN